MYVRGDSVTIKKYPAAEEKFRYDDVQLSVALLSLSIWLPGCSVQNNISRAGRKYGTRRKEGREGRECHMKVMGLEGAAPKK